MKQLVTSADFLLRLEVMTASATRILIVDDEAQQVQALTSTLDLAGYTTEGVSSATAAG